MHRTLACYTRLQSNLGANISQCMRVSAISPRERLAVNGLNGGFWRPLEHFILHQACSVVLLALADDD